MPLANALIAPEQVREPEPAYPLVAARCASCGEVQLTVVVRPDVLFAHYLYASSASAPLLTHFDAYAADVAERFAPRGSLVVELGSNDGVLLRPLKSRGLIVVGVEPATNLADVANAAGLTTVNDFFSEAVARAIRRSRGAAKAVIANNVLAHIDDLGDVLRGLDALLSDDGVFVAEVPYLGDLIEHVEYDTIYHEHLSYFAIAPLARLFDLASMELFDVRHLPIHGGSIRIFAGRKGRHAPTEELPRMLAAEERAGLGDPETYRRFDERVRASRTALRELIIAERGRGARVAALGATAKGNTLLNYCRLGPAEVEYIGDSTRLKQGLLTPGMHIPVVAEAKLKDDRPELILLLAWNYADAIVPRYRDYLEAGGRFIHPIPLARIIGE
ncbi:MAG TPA: methyltransferase [Chloroflexi bacterium]|jgi:novobiocin biosynthesis protein NovU/D-mycarose 3-C-methyltransferase|nr:methyltransferase [Chloroflexota bacterium]HAL26173.1 methyltransferase [Chloroflexota bacterium]